MKSRTPYEILDVNENVTLAEMLASFNNKTETERTTDLITAFVEIAKKGASFQETASCLRQLAQVGATPKDLEKLFRLHLSRLYHPDKATTTEKPREQAEEEFKQLNNLIIELTNPKVALGIKKSPPYATDPEPDDIHIVAFKGQPPTNQNEPVVLVLTGFNLIQIEFIKKFIKEKIDPISHILHWQDDKLYIYSEGVEFSTENTNQLNVFATINSDFQKFVNRLFDNNLIFESREEALVSQIQTADLFRKPPEAKKSGPDQIQVVSVKAQPSTLVLTGFNAAQTAYLKKTISAIAAAQSTEQLHNADEKGQSRKIAGLDWEFREDALVLTSMDDLFPGYPIAYTEYRLDKELPINDDFLFLIEILVYNNLLSIEKAKQIVADVSEQIFLKALQFRDYSTARATQAGMSLSPTQGKDEETELHLAVKSEHREAIIRYLIQHIDVNTTIKNGYTPLHWAIIFNPNPEKVVALLLDEAKPNLNLKARDEPIIYFVLSKMGDKIEAAIKARNFDLVGKLNKTQFALLKLLIAHGADLNAVDDGTTVLHRVLHSGKNPEREQNEKANLLLYFKPNVNVYDRFGQTSFHCAIITGHLSLAKKMIREHNADVNAPVRTKDIPIRLELISTLQSRDGVLYDPDLEDLSFTTEPEDKVLYVRMRNGNLEFIVKNDSGVVRDRIPQADLETILKPTNLSALEPFSLDKLAPFLQEITDYTGGKGRASNDSPRRPRRHLDAQQGQTAAHLAMMHGDLELLKLLKEYKANFQAKDKKGNTPISIAMERLTFPVCQFLVHECKMDVNESTNGKLLLHSAVSSGSIKTVELILNAGANINARDASGRTAFEIALHFENKAMLNLLINRGAELSFPLPEEEKGSPDEKMQPAMLEVLDESGNESGNEDEKEHEKEHVVAPKKKSIREIVHKTHVRLVSEWLKRSIDENNPILLHRVLSANPPHDAEFANISPFFFKALNNLRNQQYKSNIVQPFLEYFLKNCSEEQFFKIVNSIELESGAYERTTQTIIGKLVSIGERELIEKILEKYPHALSIPCIANRSALYTAIGNPKRLMAWYGAADHVEFIKFLTAHGAQLYCGTPPLDFETPVTLAARSGAVEYLKCQLQEDKQAYLRRAGNGETVLHAALSGSVIHGLVVDKILGDPEVKSIINAVDNLGVSPLFLVVSRGDETQISSVYRTLVESQVDLKSALLTATVRGQNILHAAANNKLYSKNFINDIFKYVTELLDKEDVERRTPLFLAIENDNYDIAKIYIDNRASLINSQNKNIIQCMIEKSQNSLLSRLLHDKNSRILALLNQVDAQGHTPVTRALSLNRQSRTKMQTDMIKTLLKQPQVDFGMEFKIHSPEGELGSHTVKSFSSILDFALNSAHECDEDMVISIIKEIMKTSPELLRKRGTNGMLPLTQILTTFNFDHLQSVVDTLLRANFPFHDFKAKDAKDTVSNTPLHILVKRFSEVTRINVEYANVSLNEDPHAQGTLIEGIKSFLKAETVPPTALIAPNQDNDTPVHLLLKTIADMRVRMAQRQYDWSGDRMLNKDCEYMAKFFDSILQNPKFKANIPTLVEHANNDGDTILHLAAKLYADPNVDEHEHANTIFISCIRAISNPAIFKQKNKEGDTIEDIVNRYRHNWCNLDPSPTNEIAEHLYNLTHYADYAEKQSDYKATEPPPAALSLSSSTPTTTETDTAAYSSQLVLFSPKNPAAATSGPDAAEARQANITSSPKKGAKS